MEFLLEGLQAAILKASSLAEVLVSPGLLVPLCRDRPRQRKRQSKQAWEFLARRYGYTL